MICRGRGSDPCTGASRLVPWQLMAAAGRVNPLLHLTMQYHRDIGYPFSSSYRRAMTPSLDHDDDPFRESEVVRQRRPDTDQLISVIDIRALFKLGRTAAYELTRRPGFPASVRVSRRCLRWWASEVDAYADSLQSQVPRRRTHPTTQHQDNPAVQPRKITGTVRAARGPREPT